MGSFLVDLDRPRGLIRLALSGSVSEAEMNRGFAALRDAIGRLGGEDFRILSNERELKPLGPAAARVQERAKAYCAATPGYLGNAVLVKDPITRMQSRRTSKSAQIDDRELVSSDTGEVEKFIATSPRRAKSG